MINPRHQRENFSNINCQLWARPETLIYLFNAITMGIKVQSMHGITAPQITANLSCRRKLNDIIRDITITSLHHCKLH